MRFFATGGPSDRTRLRRAHRFALPVAQTRQGNAPSALPRGLFVVLLLATLACGHPGRRQPAWPDAPMQLRDESDREQAIDQLWVLPLGAERDAVRVAIANAIAARINDALEEDRPLVAELLLFQLASLWQLDAALVKSHGLAAHLELIKKLRATFAKSGSLEPAIMTLVLLAELEPERTTEHMTELDEVLNFADDLEAAENGPEAERAQPIKLLQPSVLALPLPWLVDKYVTLLQQRQRVISELIQAQGASIQLVRAHHDILATSLRIAIAVARAGRTDDIARYLADIKGLGADRELTIRAELVASQATANAYYELAEAVRNEKDNGDPGAALAVCLAGLRRFPADASLLASAAQDAASLGRVDQPIALYEAAIRARGGDVDSALALRLGKLYAERIARLAFGGRPAAATTAWHDLARYTKQVSRKAPHQVWSLVAANGETALGRGLLSQGRLREAEKALVASLGRAPSIDAYETLATIHYKTGRLDSSVRYASTGIAMLGETKSDHVRHAKLARIAGDASRAAGRSRNAANFYLDAMRMWASLGPDQELPVELRAERKIEFARSLWFIGESEKAVNLIFEGIDADPSEAANYATSAAFLIQIGNYAEALDIVHRALSQSDVSEFYKVYMCLWVLGEARQRGEPRDRQAFEFLATRQGDLWYELLAQAATNRLDLPALRAAATTGPREAELAFYSVVLGLDPDAATPAGARKLLMSVVEAKLVMDAEYDLARQYLARP
jgi:tetratricopeptide (TPR) repeat protein